MAQQELHFQSGCPPSGALSAFLLGDLASPECETIVAHLEACTSCQESIATLEQAQNAILQRFRGYDGSLVAVEEPCWRRLESAARRLHINGAMPRNVGAVSEDDKVPARIGPYELQAKIGQGGMSAVYRALHVNLRREVALKLLPARQAENRRHLARFYREMEAIGKISSPHVVHASDAGEADGWHYLAMELVPGVDVGRLVNANGRLPLADACEIIRQAALGLIAINEHGLVHRDIKPSNLLLTSAGQIKILDLGLARLLSLTDDRSDLTESEHILGTAAYMAPEQVGNSRQVDIRADIYSLGCTFYKLLTGRAPFSGSKYESPQAKLLAHLHDDPPPLRSLLPEVPVELATIVERMLKKDVNARTALPGDVADSVRSFAEGHNFAPLLRRCEECRDPQDEEEAHRSVAPATTVSFVSTPARSRNRTRSAVVAICLALAAMLIATAWNIPWTGGNVSNEKTENISPLVQAIPASESLPFDVSNLRPLVWHNLLAQPPRTPDWQPLSLGSLIQPIPDRRQVYISSRPYCFAQLGTIHRPKYRLQVRVDQKHWPGGFGVFLGMRDDVNEKGERVVRCQLFELRPYLQHDPKQAYAWRRLKVLVTFSQAGIPSVSTEGGRTASVPKPIDTEQLLEVSIQIDGLTAFNWAGQSLPEFCDNQADAKFGPEDYNGALGVFIGNSDAMFRDASLLLE